MENFPAYYTMLFNAITEALRLIGKSRHADAALLLKDAQIRAEDAYIEADSSPACPRGLTGGSSPAAPPFPTPARRFIPARHRGRRYPDQPPYNRRRAGQGPALRFSYSAFKRPVASLNASISSSRSFAWAWTASQIPSYHRALSSSTVLPCCSTQV